MPNNKYIRGANFERWVLNKLREQGYDGMRSAGSHSSADLFIWNNNNPLGLDFPELYLIQCKTSREREFNLTDLIWQDEVRELTGMLECFKKVLLIKQYRLITQVAWTYKNGELSWNIQDVFNLK